MKKLLTFALISDFHYRKRAFTTSIGQLESLLSAAKAAGAAFVMHAGDFCGDYLGSPELCRAYLDNPQELSVYGIYGNHELDCRGNTMSYVTPRLTNRAVSWGTPDGSIGDGSVGYYSFDIGCFRILGLDANYSLNPQTGAWEHNRAGSFGAPKGNLCDRSLGSAQLTWLAGQLDDAAKRGLHCLLFSHFGTSGGDADALASLIEQANQKRRGTVLFFASGHYHSEHAEVRGNVLYYSVNSVSNTIWRPDTESHYPPDCRFRFTDYDEDGNPTGTSDVPVAELSQARHVWFFTEPLYAIVTVDADGYIEIQGSKTEWLCGIVPPYTIDGVHPWISDCSFDLNA